MTGIEASLAQEVTDDIIFFPKAEEVFSTFRLVKPEDINVCIWGQDPYHGMNPDGTSEATGMSFSVRQGEHIPSSLQNIFKEIKMEYPDYQIPKHGDLSNWGRQGVFMVNGAFTVRMKTPGSHSRMWEKFTSLLINYIASLPQQPIFVLWGSKVQKLVTSALKRDVVKIDGVHPSGLSAHRGFFGCGHFKLINDLLEKREQRIIDW